MAIGGHKLLALGLAAAVCSASNDATYTRYIVVGAGPAGLQLGHYLDSADRDYLILDKAPSSASFFARFPRWNQLISINKPNTGHWQLDAVYRQDWNSLNAEHSTSSALARSFNFSRVPCLLQHTAPVAPKGARGKGATGAAAESLVSAGASCAAADYSSSDERYTDGGIARGLRFGELTADYYPEARLLHRFLNDWASESAPRGAVTPEDPPLSRAIRVQHGVEVVNVSRPAGYGAAVAASGGSQAALIASGAPRFRLTASDGRVFECTFLIWAPGMQKLNRAEGVNVAELAESYWTHSTDVEAYRNKSVLIIGRGNAAFEVASHLLHVASLVHVVGRDTARIRLATETHYPGDVRHVHSRLLETYLLKSQDGLAELPQGAWELVRDNATGRYTVVDRNVQCRRDAHGRPLERCLLQRSYDKVISCPGWHVDTSPFAPDIRPALAPNAKHFALTPEYEAPGVKGLFFAGTVAHAADFKVSSGGFIHGFRYVVRALHRHLEEVEQAAWASTASAAVAAAAAVTAAPTPLSPPPAAWPRRPVTGLRSAASTLLRRANVAAGPFQMFGSLADTYVLAPLPAAATSAFVDVGPAAPFVDPSSFYDPNVTDSLLFQEPPQPLDPSDAAGAARRASDDVLDLALRGALFEEVPLRLAHLKALGWAAQVAATTPGVPGTGPFEASSAGGAEYITLTLEFGGKGGFGPDGQYRYGLPDAGAGSVGAASRKASGSKMASSASSMTHTSATKMKPKSEWDADPYALWRANVTFYEPEKSRFLHPVLRYYHTRLAPGDLAPGEMPPPVLEHHVLEDFNNAFTNFQAHVLSLARFLQDVAARRVAAARAIAGAPRVPPPAIMNAIASAATPAPQPSTVSSLDVQRSLRAALTPPPRPFRTLMLSNVRHILHMPYATLYFRGLEIPGGEAWWHRLSMAAGDELMYTGAITMLSTHWLDNAPFPLTPEENATWAALQEESKTAAAAGTGSAGARISLAVALAMARPPMTDQQAAEQEALEELYRGFFTARSAAAPHIAFMVVRARTGLGAHHAGEFSIPALPFHRVIDIAKDRQRDLPHGAIIADLQAWATAAGLGVSEDEASAARVAQGKPYGQKQEEVVLPATPGGSKPGTGAHLGGGASGGR